MVTCSFLRVPGVLSSSVAPIYPLWLLEADMAEVDNTLFQNSVTRHVRATIAAALIQSKAVDLTGINWYSEESIKNSTGLEQLKVAVDAVMKAMY
jgi:hypothetical protein